VAREAKRVYGPEAQDVITVVWETLDYICAERLTPTLLTTARHLAGFRAVRLTPSVEEQLAAISRPTVARMLSRLRQDKGRRPRKGLGKAGKMRAGIPAGRLSWDIAESGHFETDLVHHCGTAPIGTYVHTLQLIDSATGWSERVAVYGRGEEGMVDGFKRVERRVPFPIREIHPDNGSEFFNPHVVRYFGSAAMPVQLSRSRPFQKNGDRFVGQKNATLGRAFFGSWRIDTYNFLQPVQHLVAKEMTDGKLRRVSGEPKTPFDRLLATAC
jgi:hypothetical protein